MLNNKRGQSTVEYIILVTAVIGVMIVFATNKDSGLQQKLGNAYNQVGDDMAGKAGTLAGSHDTEDPATPDPNQGTPPAGFAIDMGTMSTADVKTGRP